MPYSIDTLKGQVIGFEQVSAICKEIYRSEDKLINLVFPDIILTAFACEVAIKGIYYLEKDKELKGTHGLKCLFSQLDEPLRKEISTGINDFDTLLEQNKNIFYDWRYLYEKTGRMNVGIGFLDDFLKALHKKLFSYAK